VKQFTSELQGLFFDLDGTLLQVEMQQFIPAYLEDLSRQFVDNVPAERFSRVARQAVHALLREGDAERTNRERYLAMIERHLSIPPGLFEERLELWLEESLHRLSGHVSPIDHVRPLLDDCFTLGIPIILATNPVFPAAMIEARLAWSGLEDYPFNFITSYENTRYCKPQQGYFQDLLDRFELEARHCLMVGNDTEHDLAAAKVGIKTFLVDTYLIDRTDGKYSYDYRGELTDLHGLVQTFV